MAVFLHEDDLPKGCLPHGDLALSVDSLEYNNARSTLKSIQLSDGSGDVHVVRFRGIIGSGTPHLIRVLSDERRVKILDHAALTLAKMQHNLGLKLRSVHCITVASKLTRTYASKHNLDTLIDELPNMHTHLRCGAKFQEDESETPWLEAAAKRVRFLHILREEQLRALRRENRMELAQSCFAYLPARAELVLHGWHDRDILAFS